MCNAGESKCEPFIKNIKYERQSLARRFVSRRVVDGTESDKSGLHVAIRFLRRTVTSEP